MLLSPLMAGSHLGSEQVLSPMTLFTVYAYLSSPLTWMAFVLGAVIGSFLNVCIFRIPEGSMFQQARSVCRGCGAPIPAWLNLPIFGYFLLRGRARCCGQRLSRQYPLVELLTGLIFVCVYWKFPFLVFTDRGVSLDYPDLIRAAHASVFLCLMIVCSFIDLRLMIIPDVISLPMILLTPIVALIHPDLEWSAAIIGVVAGAGSLYFIAWLYYLIRKETGMGAGDVKLLAAIGGWLGYQAIFPTLFYGSLLGAASGLLAIVVTKKLNLKSEIPFGPFLAIGATLHLLVGSNLQEIIFIQ